MLKLKNFTKNSFLTSFDVPKQERQVSVVSKPRKTGKQQYTKGQVRKQAKKQGVKLPYKVIEKIAKTKQTKNQLYQKIAYQGRKQKAQNFRNVLKTQGDKYMELVKRYANLTLREYERHPTKENLARLHESQLLIKQARLYDERFRPYWSEFKQDIKELKQRLRASRHAGNVSKPKITKAGTSMEDYVLTYFATEVEDKVSAGMDESEAINEVFQEKVADGTLEVLKQYYDTGVLYGYWDSENLEVISPI